MGLCYIEFELMNVTNEKPSEKKNNNNNLNKKP